MDTLQASLAARDRIREETQGEAGRNEYKLAVLQQDLRRRAQTLGRMLEELDQLTSEKGNHAINYEAIQYTLADSDVVRLAIGTRGLHLNMDDRLQLVARAVDNDRGG